MDQPIRFFIGLDVHKDSIAIAASQANSRDEARFIGTTGHSVHQVVKALSRSQCSPSELAIAYEAGPCGYGLARELIARGYNCEVVAPSRVPRRPADRIKTDRRDALLLARLHRSAELVAVAVPDPSDEAVRDLTRARDDAVKAQRCARQQLMALLLRLGKPYREAVAGLRSFCVSWPISSSTTLITGLSLQSTVWPCSRPANGSNGSKPASEKHSTPGAGNRSSRR